MPDSNREYLEGEVVSGRPSKPTEPVDEIAAALKARMPAQSTHVIHPPRTFAQRAAEKVRDATQAVKDALAEKPTE